MDSSSADLSAAATALLRENGPHTLSELAAALSGRGFGDAARIEAAIELDDALVDPVITELRDGRYVALDAVLDGRVFTHRLTAEEIAANALEMFDVLLPALVLPNQPPISVGVPGFHDEILASRSLTDKPWAQFGVVVLPEDFLASCRAGDLVALTVRHGDVTVRQVSEEPAPGTLGEWVSAMSARAGETDLFIELQLLEALVADPHLARDTCAPVSEQLAGTGFERTGNKLTRTGTEPAASPAEHETAASGWFGKAFGLDAGSARAATRFLALLMSWSLEEDDVEFSLDAYPEEYFEDPETLTPLADPAVARLVQDEALLRLGIEPYEVARAAEQLLRRGPRVTRAAAHWMIGQAELARGDVHEAERRYQLATSENPGFSPALEGLATFASMRGDATAGLLLLERTPTGTQHAMYPFLQHFKPVEHPELGRNDRCWCGSGHKYKVCHLGRSDAPLERRAVWLYAKAGLIIDQPRWQRLFAEVDQANDDVRLVSDVVLFDGGAFDDFVEHWATTLPDDERDLAQRWRGAPLVMGVLDEVRSGEGFTLRDTRNGERTRVMDRTVGNDVSAGATVVVRPLPVGGEWHNYIGVHPVPDGRHEAMRALLDAPELSPQAVGRVLGDSDR
ncbi:SEC-C motif-containing protein [Rhodococcus sp. SMB37]|uniref:SEC-C metal-binding domain-containing protein n=1 Tax=Rhodococcus sp. SMB37 TaxID=2512213 RepID=UPI0010480D5D|nr:SEC-C metal-binding domain-containing protein [Rhodococcus sp. SMB37]TCN58082.1 SEC-C motif-containing protein [Rhodococcus sp. SMB37]